MSSMAPPSARSRRGRRRGVGVRMRTLGRRCDEGPKGLSQVYEHCVTRSLATNESARRSHVLRDAVIETDLGATLVRGSRVHALTLVSGLGRLAEPDVARARMC